MISRDGIARPKRVKETRPRLQVNISVTVDEYLLLKKQARKAHLFYRGQPNVSGFLRLKAELKP